MDVSPALITSLNKGIEYGVFHHILTAEVDVSVISPPTSKLIPVSGMDCSSRAGKGTVDLKETLH